MGTISCRKCGSKKSGMYYNGFCEKCVSDFTNELNTSWLMSLCYDNNLNIIEHDTQKENYIFCENCTFWEFGRTDPKFDDTTSSSCSICTHSTCYKQIVSPTRIFSKRVKGNKSLNKDNNCKYFNQKAHIKESVFKNALRRLIDNM